MQNRDPQRQPPTTTIYYTVPLWRNRAEVGRGAYHVCEKHTSWGLFEKAAIQLTWLTSCMSGNSFTKNTRQESVDQNAGGQLRCWLCRFATQDGAHNPNPWSPSVHHRLFPMQIAAAAYDLPCHSGLKSSFFMSFSWLSTSIGCGPLFDMAAGKKISRGFPTNATSGRFGVDWPHVSSSASWCSGPSLSSGAHCSWSTTLIQMQQENPQWHEILTRTSPHGSAAPVVSR